MRSYKRVSRLFVFSVMLSVIAVLGVLFFCLNVLFDVHLFVLFCEPKCGDFDFAFLAVKTVNCGLPERGCGKRNRCRLSVLF